MVSSKKGMMIAMMSYGLRVTGYELRVMSYESAVCQNAATLSSGVQSTSYFFTLFTFFAVLWNLTAL
jgi:hypothetical protein